MTEIHLIDYWSELIIGKFKILYGITQILFSLRVAEKRLSPQSEAQLLENCPALRKLLWRRQDVLEPELRRNALQPLPQLLLGERLGRHLQQEGWLQCLSSFARTMGHIGSRRRRWPPLRQWGSGPEVFAASFSAHFGLWTQQAPALLLALRRSSFLVREELRLRLPKLLLFFLLLRFSISAFFAMYSLVRPADSPYEQRPDVASASWPAVSLPFVPTRRVD